jgi:hypothetical protein
MLNGLQAGSMEKESGSVPQGSLVPEEPSVNKT